jgi:hypothetical protein
MKKITDGDRFEGRLVEDPRFAKRVAEARESFRDGGGTKLEDVEE